VPSLAQRAPLWGGGLDEYEQPLRYVDLAEALPETRSWMVPRRPDLERSGGSPADAANTALEREVRERAA
jgi:hypothetical protein